MSCTYIYKNKRYSKAGLLRVLSQNPATISEGALDFLRTKLGMLDNEVIIVSGLIDNKALGRFKEDGTILLSSFANDSVAYHEAFHRVFRMYLMPDERLQYFESFKKRKNYQSLIEGYKIQYPENSEDENIEEFLADEFSDYILNNQKLNIDNETRSIFEKIIAFLKKLLGLKKKDITDLYANIAKGTFSGKPLDKQYRYNKSAYKIEIGSNVYSHDIKNEFIQAVSREFISEILKQGSIYDFIKNKIDASTQAELYNQSFVRVVESLIDYHPDLVNDFLDDYEKGPAGYLNNQFKMYIETLIGKFDLTYIEESEKQLDENGVGEEEKGRQNDDAAKAWTASIEIDPKTSMSKAIKLLLASFENQNNINSLGLYSQVRWTNAFNKIAQHMSGIPTSDAIQHLAKLNEPWVTDLINYLGGVNPEGTSLTLEHIRLRNDFIKTFSKNTNTFLLAEIGNDTIKVFDANQNTQQKKKLREWNDAMILAAKQATENGSFDGWVKRLKTELIDARNPSDASYEELLGIKIEDELKNQVIFTQNGQDFYYMSAMNAIATHIIKAVSLNSFSDSKLPDWRNLFSRNNFDIEGTMKKLADAQNEFEDVVDLMIFNRNKKLYGISLNTHTTHTINTLNYIADLIDPKMSINEKLDIINKYLPNILNYQTVDKINGEYVIKSKWLEHIMMGNRISMVIADGIKNQLGDDEALSDVDESDLFATTLNLSLRGVNISFKHSDRSTFFAYKLENGSIFDYQNGYNTAEDIVKYLTTVLQDQLATEVRRAKLENIPMFQYFKDKYKDSQIFNLKNIAQLNPYSSEIEKLIANEVQSNLDNYKNELTKWGVLDNTDHGIKGLSPDLLAYHNDNLDLTLASSFANQLLTHLEEMKVFLGDFAFFKTADDFYKRMSTTSGTGENLVNDEVTNAKIAKMNEIEFEIYSPRVGGESITMKYDKTIDGSIKSITLNEKDDYYSRDAVDLTEISPIDGSAVSKLQYTYEWNILKDFDNPSDVIKAKIKKLAAEYTKNYSKINENDGQSWMNMFFYREYMVRLGTWTQAMENLFKVELKILNARTPEDIENITITVGGQEINVFDSKHWKNGLFENVHTLKSQYAGFTKAYTDYKNETEQAFNERIRPYTIYKTSYHVLWPSIVHGTNLSQMHFFMLKNKVDVIHMGSANKTGGIDAKAVFKNREAELNTDQQRVAKNGLDFYDQYGYFNDYVFEGELGQQLLDGVSSIANVDSMKDQVKIGNKEKDEIKGSTQSLKILLSNLIVNGKERFEGAAQLAADYKKVINELVNRSVSTLLNELGADSEGVNKFESLVQVIKRSAEDRSSAINIIEAIEGFLYDPYIESLPNKNKIENIFYSIITNNVISFNRPGNSYPQVASTGYEPLGNRIVGANNEIANNEEIAFYGIETNENGDITKVTPSELVIPLPKAWMAEVLKRAKTNNIAKAINWLNNEIEKGNVNITTKGVRIPNQQLSSNDIFRIKRFTLPTNANFVIVPSEIVTKVGADSLLKFAH